MSQSNNTTSKKDQPVYIRGRKAAMLRNYGELCDIRRHSNGFLYNPRHSVAISEELLEALSDNVILQFTNMDTRDVWTVTVRDFRRMATPIQYGNFEPQRAVEVDRIAHRGGSKPRHNELRHIEHEPIEPAARQMGLFS